MQVDLNKLVNSNEALKLLKLKQEIKNLHKNKKAKKAWEYLTDDETREVLFGGGKMGGKTTLLADWFVWNCMTKPGIKCLALRQKFSDLQDSTVATFINHVLPRVGLEEGKDFTIIGGEKVREINFPNKSVIHFRHLDEKPGDREMHSSGGKEYTLVAIDEAVQVSASAKESALEMIRYKLEEFGFTKKKLLLTCNPSNTSWAFFDFYQPWKNKTLDKTKKFVKALIVDNPYATEEEIDSLRNSPDPLRRERLFYGNWEYDDDDTKLYPYNEIQDIFTNQFVLPGETYITADIALQGSDLMVVGIWSGLRLIDVIIEEKTDGLEVQNIIEQQAIIHHVPRSRIAVDSDGVGSYLTSYMQGVVGFVNNGSPKFGENYQNLKAQCAYKLQEIIDQIFITEKVSNKYIPNLGKTFKEALVEEMGQVRRKDVDKDGKLAIVSKKIIKQNIKRSPDLYDMVMMRCFFELQNKAIKLKFKVLQPI